MLIRRAYLAAALASVADARPAPRAGAGQHLGDLSPAARTLTYQALLRPEK